MDVPTICNGSVIYHAGIIDTLKHNIAPQSYKPGGYSNVLVHVRCEENNLIIEVSLTDFSAIFRSDYYVVCNEIALRAWERLVIIFGYHISELSQKEDTVVASGKFKEIFISRTLSVDGKCSRISSEPAVHTLEPDQLVFLSSETSHTNEELYKDFNGAFALPDIESRFLAFYRILSILCKDAQNKESQEEVDKFIQDKMPDTPFEPSHRFPVVTGKVYPAETLYTRLRNECGHVRPDTHILRTRHEMEQHIDKLSSLVRIRLIQN